MKVLILVVIITFVWIFALVGIIVRSITSVTTPISLSIYNIYGYTMINSNMIVSCDMAYAIAIIEIVGDLMEFPPVLFRKLQLKRLPIVWDWLRNWCLREAFSLFLFSFRLYFLFFFSSSWFDIVKFQIKTVTLRWSSNEAPDSFIIFFFTLRPIFCSSSASMVNRIYLV